MKQAGTSRTLYRLGGVAVLLTLTLYLSQFILIRWDEYPASTRDWFALFQRSKLLGLFYMNAVDILSITLLGVMFLALLSALKPARHWARWEQQPRKRSDSCSWLLLSS